MKFKEGFMYEFHNLIKGKFPIMVIIFALPLMFTVLFGLVYHANVVENIPMVIYDQDQSSLSRTLIQSYTDSERFYVISYVDTQEELEDRISSGEALVGLAIPRDFSKNTKRGVTSNIGLVVDSANNMFGNAALSAAQEINRTIAMGVGEKLIEGIGVLPNAALNMVYPVRFTIRILHNPTNGYTPFMLSGLMMNGLQIGLMLVIGPLIAIEIKRKKYQQSISSFLVIAYKCIPCWIAAIFAYVISLIVMHAFFEVPILGPWWELLLLGSVFVYFVICALVLLSACSPTVVMSLQIPLLYIMPGLLYSGLSWPEFVMNDAAWYVSRIFPLTYTGDNLRDLLLAGYAPRLWSDMGYMMLIGTVFLLAGILIFSIRRKYDPKKMLISHVKQLHHHKEAV